MEGLVAGGLVGILAAMMVPLFGHVVRTKENVTCASNLRQIGIASLAYANDHDGRLPGPLLHNQYVYWNHYTVLSWYLEDYVPIIKSRWKLKGDIFICPANRRLVKARHDSIPVFLANTHVKMAGRDGPQVPFGYPNSYYSGLRKRTEDELPMRLAELDAIVDADGRPARSRTWAIKCADGLDHSLVQQRAFAVRHLPKQMVHGTHRNALLFTFHMGRVGLDDEPL